MRDNSILGHLLDIFFVTKLQISHGSQHDHGLLWVANAPIYGLDPKNAITNFVDKYISCDNNKLTSNLVKFKHIVKSRLEGRKIK
jgi:hypothetical protein